MDAGLHLAPTQRSVVITNRPVLDVNFSQFRAKVSGTISCMGEEACQENVSDSDDDDDDEN